MTFISYAQNFEDVMLWRALSHHVHKGFFIDVGAWSPDLHSVTKAFSERGWSGINIEPNPHFHSQLVEKRSSEINLRVAVGDRTGNVPMSLSKVPAFPRSMVRLQKNTKRQDGRWKRAMWR
jgi:FkbM family methyltransferase